jgi:exopolysaccharide production protein ExoY
MTTHMKDLTTIDSQPVTLVDRQRKSSMAWSYKTHYKRVFDVVFVLLAAPVAVPVIALMALLVALDGATPFYRQRRVGKNGHIFGMLKMRTMVPNAHDRLESHLAKDPRARQEWDSTQKLKNDPRITTVGKVLRKSSLDELPQLWNVLRGDMSIVGPRPMMEDQVDLYPGSEYYALLPGITGPWQVSDRNKTTFAQRARYDTEYHNTLSLKTDLSFADPLLLIDDDELDDTDLIVDNGTRVTTAGRLFFEGGLNDPFGYGIELEHEGLQYSGTSDPGLFDSWTNSAAVFTRYRLSPVAEARLTASWEEYDADDTVNTNRETLGLTAGLVYDIDPVTQLEASLGYTYITRTTNLPSSTVQEGLSGSVGLTREMVNGSAGLLLESDLTANGRLSTLTARRAVELPTGALEASVGLSLGPSGTFIPIGSLDYIYALPRGEITASIRRTATINTAGNDVSKIGASLGYSTEINRVSSLAFEADFASVADLGAAPVDRTTLTSLRATYAYELTPDWDLAAGYEHRIRTETGETRRSSNEVFLTLNYTFYNRP